MIHWTRRAARDVRRALRQFAGHARLCYGEQRRLGMGVVRSAVRAVRALVWPGSWVACWPQQPSPVYLQSILMARCGQRPVPGWVSAAAGAMRFADETRQSPAEPVFPGRPRAINAGSFDISKQAVQRHFESTFGYPLAVDPVRHVGPMVEKSDRNFTHDGRILCGPIAPEEVREGCVYQRLVDTVDGAGFAVDLRTIMVGGRAVVVYRKHRPVADRFSARNHSVEILDPADVFEGEELACLGAFAALMGVDFAALDVLRDREDGRIYVVDVNNTPGGLPRPITAAQRMDLLDRLEPAWRALVTWSSGARIAGRADRP